MDEQLGDVRVRREPIFNVPTAVVAALAVLVLVHIVREWVLTQPQDAQLLFWFAFIPARYDAAVIAACRRRSRDLGPASGRSSPTR